MESIDIEVRLNQKIDVTVHIGDVIQGINEVPMVKRWNYISQIINSIELNLIDITGEQKEIIKNYLTEKLKLFNP